MRLKPIIKFAVLVILVALLLIWMVDLVKCEYLSFRYSEQFESLYLEYTMFRTPKYIKVIDYTDTEATVYYISPKFGGNLVYYKRKDVKSAWEFANWKTVWSSSGSADGIVWPYMMWGRLA